MNRLFSIFFSLLFGTLAAQVQILDAKVNVLRANPEIRTAAEQLDRYLPLLEGKKTGLVANQSSLVGDRHLVDVLREQGITVAAVFAPEHGFRGDASAGEQISDGRDKATGIPIYSLYGKTKKPSPAMLRGIEVLVFDMQDVGARFYTYLSTLHYVMEAAAEEGIPVIVLDRPNPNGFYTDGPVLDLNYQSFVGMHPIPMVHGMTLGELAQMINGEGWLAGALKADLKVIPCANYRKSDLYELPVAPSPNLASMEAVYLYPSLCLFEATIMSIGRGTEQAFEVYGHPDLSVGSFAFTPQHLPGKASHPKHEGKECFGQNLKEFAAFYFHTHREVYLDWLIASYTYFSENGTEDFFSAPGFFDKLAGTKQLREQIKGGLTSDQIRASWSEDLEAFKKRRSPYLLYP